VDNKRLYPNQVEAHRTLYSFWSAGDPVFGLVSPTGSGKSTVVRSLVARLEAESAVGRRGCRSVFVIVPQTHIQDSFLGCGSVKIEGEKTYKTGSQTWLPARSTTTARLSSVLRSKKRSMWFAATSCYKTLQNALELALSRGKVDLTGRLLAVDEGHHAGVDATKLHQLTKQWVQYGGRVLLVTATPYRNDGKAVFQPEQPQYVRTIAEHALDTDHDGNRLVPSRMWMCAERLSGYKATTTKELNGASCPTGITGHATLSLTRRWEKDGKPKTVIIVPSHKSKSWALKLKTAFENRGARVLNAVGVGSEAKEALRSTLITEGEVERFEDSTVDVILACKRFDEGTDWPLCSHIYVVGFPRSLPLTVQRWGRTFRPKHKISGHTHGEDAAIVFFCPDPTGLGGNAMQVHKQAALLTACHLHDFETAQHYTRRIGIGRVVGDAIRSRYDLKFVQRVTGALKTTEHDRALAKKAIQEIVGGEEGLSVPEVARRLADKKLTGAGYLAALGQLLEDVSEGDLTKKEARQLRYSLDKALGKTQRKSSGTVRLISKELIEAFNEVLENYDDITVKADQGILLMTGMFTGQTAKEIGEALRRCIWCMRVTPEKATEIVRAHFAQHQRRPTRRFSKMFHRIDQTLSRNFRMSLTDLCDEMGLPKLRKQRSQEGARAEVQAYFDEHGHRPDQNKSAEWACWNGYLKYNHNFYLWELCDEMGLPSLTVKRTRDGVRAEVQTYFDEHGVRPPLSGDKKWVNISSYLKYNHHLTLRQLCDEMGLSKSLVRPGTKTKYTKDDPIKFAQAYFDEHGVRPTRQSPGGKKWDSWLTSLLKTTLSQLCDELGMPPLRRKRKTTTCKPKQTSQTTTLSI
jgi:superfamily II DNA or RNA helicase